MLKCTPNCQVILLSVQGSSFMKSKGLDSESFFANMISLIEWIDKELPAFDGSLGALVYAPDDEEFVSHLCARLAQPDFSIKLDCVQTTAEWAALPSQPPVLLPVLSIAFYNSDSCKEVLQVAMKTQPWMLPVRYKLPLERLEIDEFVQACMGGANRVQACMGGANRVPANEDFGLGVEAHLKQLAAAICQLAPADREQNTLTLARIPKYNSMIRKLVKIPSLRGRFDINKDGMRLADQVCAIRTWQFCALVRTLLPGFVLMGHEVL